MLALGPNVVFNRSHSLEQSSSSPHATTVSSFLGDPSQNMKVLGGRLCHFLANTIERGDRG
jgi:hypothetical protein